MTKIIVLFVRETDSVARLLARLQAHFGAKRVQAAPGRLPPSITNSVIVALLSATQSLEGDSGGGLPLDDFVTWKATGIDVALGSECRVLPMLLDKANMPAHTAIPEPYRKIAFKHALPIRCGNELDRDVGRLITDLEQHLQFSPANIFAWDQWLIPVGIIGAVICSPFLMLWLWDAWYWNYAYVTAQRYREACWWLTEFGPNLLGVLLLLMSTGFAYRHHRLRVLARTEHFHTGQGKLPPDENRWLVAARLFTWSSLGCGWWTGALAVASVVGAIVHAARDQLPQPKWRTIALILIVSTVASAWGLWRDASTARLETALHENDLGRVALDAGKLDEAQGHFESAITIYPNLGRSYEGLGLLYVRQQQNDSAYREFSRAISLYPTGIRGFFGPDNDQIVSTYRYRAQVARELGQADSAAADDMRVSELTPFIDLFGGALRFW
jgi:tetratricopeptide (TPR) repeat protein